MSEQDPNNKKPPTPETEDSPEAVATKALLSHLQGPTPEQRRLKQDPTAQARYTATALAHPNED